MNSIARAVYTILWVLEVQDARITELEKKLGINTFRSSNLDDIERESIILALKQSNGIQKEAAKILGITPRVINYKIMRYRLHEHCAVKRKS